MCVRVPVRGDEHWSMYNIEIQRHVVYTITPGLISLHEVARLFSDFSWIYDLNLNIV